MRVWLSVVMTVLIAATVEAGQGPPLPGQGPDFLLRQPAASIGVRGSWSFQRAGSDWYDFVTRHLTLDQGDFAAGGIGAEVGIRATRRVTAVVGFDVHRSATGSEYRDYVGNDQLPIAQETRLRQMHVTAGARVALVAPGRQVGQFVWIPRRVTPFAGGGIGLVQYDLEQRGEFVDFADFAVFRSTYRASGWSPGGHVLGGTHIALRRRLLATVEGRYSWASGDLGRQWVGFEPLDLSGLRLSTGIGVTF
jgi:opacity protein-like surface antigen